MEFRASAAAQGAPQAEAVQLPQVRAVPQEGVEAQADGLQAEADAPQAAGAPEPALGLVSQLTGQAAWARAWDEAARACLARSEAAAVPEAGLPGWEWELVSAGLQATGRGVRPTGEELCRPDVRGPAVERADWQPAAVGRTLTADRGEGLGRSALPAGQPASS